MLKDYGLDVQRLFLEMMLQDAESYVRVQNIYNPENFDLIKIELRKKSLVKRLQT